jgi:hypothetical protein
MLVVQVFIASLAIEFVVCFVFCIVQGSDSPVAMHGVVV